MVQDEIKAWQDQVAIVLIHIKEMVIKELHSVVAPFDNTVELASRKGQV